MSEGVRRLIAAVITVAALAVIVVGLAAGDEGGGDRVEALADRLRCPVCQSESVADSGSETAREMRAVIEEKVAAGQSDQEIEDFFIARYGEWILLDPPPRGKNLLLWVLPALGLAVGAAAIISRRKPRRAEAEQADATEARSE